MFARKIKINVYSKINLSLNILAPVNNMHALDMVLASVDIADAITVCERFDDKVNIEFSGNCELNSDSSAHKAAALLVREFSSFGADIFIEKGIPMCGGLGGSSADAAGVLFALDNLYDFSSRGFNMAAAALKLGSDVPYMQEGGYKRVKSLGETVENIDSDMQIFAVICKGEKGVSTKESYAKFDELFPQKKLILSDNDKLISALKNSDIHGLIDNINNALLRGSALLEPTITDSLNALKNAGALKAFMSGSGSACVGIFENYEKAKIAERALDNKGFYAKACKTMKTGIDIVEKIF